MFNQDFRKAPRFNPRKFQKNIVDQELYKLWKLNNPQYSISFREFRKLFETTMLVLRSKVIEERDGVRLPDGLGDLYMGYAPSTKRPVDYKTSFEIGKIVYHENWETDGKLGKLIYGTNNRQYSYEMSPYWSFDLHRDFRTSVAQSFKSNPGRYKFSIEKIYKSKKCLHQEQKDK